MLGGDARAHTYRERGRGREAPHAQSVCPPHGYLSRSNRVNNDLDQQRAHTHTERERETEGERENIVEWIRYRRNSRRDPRRVRCPAPLLAAARVRGAQAATARASFYWCQQNRSVGLRRHWRSDVAARPFLPPGPGRSADGCTEPPCVRVYTDTGSTVTPARPPRAIATAG